MNKQEKNTRIRLICEFLNRGGGKINEMESSVNEQLTDQGQKEIGRRTLQTCLECLRKGDFDHSLKNKITKSKEDIFKVQVINRSYQWAPDTIKPEFGDLDDEERFTLPFLAGILRRYESLPAVQKILYQLPQIFGISEKEMESSSAIFHSGPDLYDESNNQFEEKVIGCVINILRFIHFNQAIEFNYTPVNYYENSGEKLNLHQVAPLEIRYYENYYYLIGVLIIDKSLRTFRVDMIHRFKIDQMLDENEEPVHFDKIELEKQTNIKKLFKESMGVFPYNAKDANLYEIHIKFSDWAASYMKRLKYHHSQKIVEENKTEKYLIISINLRLVHEKHKGEEVMKRNKALSFLLGRFGENAKIVSIKLI